jgi:hypothetical protein
MFEQFKVLTEMIEGKREREREKEKMTIGPSMIRVKTMNTRIP